MKLQDAIQNQATIQFDTVKQLEIIRNILDTGGLLEDKQWMPDERYSFVKIRDEKTFELETGAYGVTTSALAFIAYNS